MSDAAWSPVRRLQSWPAPSLSLVRQERGADPSNAMVARQPILSASLEGVAHELVLGAPGLRPDDGEAIEQTLVAALADIGLDALVGAKRAFVRVTRRLL